MPDATTLQREEISDRLTTVSYVADRDIATALWLMEFLKRPLLLWGGAPDLRGPGFLLNQLRGGALQRAAKLDDARLVGHLRAFLRDQHISVQAEGGLISPTLFPLINRLCRRRKHRSSI